MRQNAYGVPRDYESGDYWRLNAQMAYSPPDSRYTITLYGTNLTDEYELNSGFLHNMRHSGDSFTVLSCHQGPQLPPR